METQNSNKYFTYCFLLKLLCASNSKGFVVTTTKIGIQANKQISDVQLSTGFYSLLPNTKHHVYVIITLGFDYTSATVFSVFRRSKRFLFQNFTDLFSDAPICVTDKMVIVGAFRNENLNIYCEVQADPPPR